MYSPGVRWFICPHGHGLGIDALTADARTKERAFASARIEKMDNNEDPKSKECAVVLDTETFRGSGTRANELDVRYPVTRASRATSPRGGGV